MTFKGVFTALVTPFKGGNIDFKSLEKLMEQQLSNGIQGLVVCGTTAESPTLSLKEKMEVLDFVIQKNKKRVPLFFGSGSNCTQSTIELSKAASQKDIEALLVVVPYYNKPPQEGMIAHFKAVADNSSKPIVLYNVPGRTVVQLAPESVIELSKYPNICGIKEADSDLNNFSKYKNLVPEDFSLFSGDDESCVNFCLLGGHGVISVCSHVAPASMVSWIDRALKREASVREDFRSQQLWIQKLYMTSNPIPVKAALYAKEILATKEVRLPLIELNDDSLKDLMSTLNEFKGLS